MIEIVNLYKKIERKIILNGLNLRVRKGKITIITGLSGSGKSVLLKTIVGLIKPDSGKVIIDGKSIFDLKGSELIKIRKKIGFLFQGGALFDSLSVFNNVAFPLREHTNLSEKQIETKVLNELREVGLSDSANKLPSELSGGMIKRAALARALILKPSCLLLDEPATGLDPVMTKIIYDMIDKISQKGITVLMISHNLQEASKIADFFAMICRGKIIEYNTPGKFFESKNPIVRQFVSGQSEGPIGLDMGA